MEIAPHRRADLVDHARPLLVVHGDCRPKQLELVAGVVGGGEQGGDILGQAAPYPSPVRVASSRARSGGRSRRRDDVRDVGADRFADGRDRQLTNEIFMARNEFASD